MRLPLLAALLTAAALPAFAEDICNVDKADWRPVEELKSELVDKGWSISNVKEEDGCYEVYGKDADGQRVEIFFDPASFEEMGSDD
ncbi:PepSY domain-containing protein [Palleronia sp. LCG004]|uniref:PepSY domain-containing protein n=1 Tax=Palleronia sp. LCG004 TaxID=3079304 RepID=UPI0029421802|nr:PepSY domain-containing protein [Palleronia sp. LCG004]WOI55714.1 PepSY domain-containing protein [Palleronia sp. LCG004]